MFPPKLVSLIFIAIASITSPGEGRRIKCYECSDVHHHDANILSCRGFQPNSTYEIDCEERQGNLCVSTWSLRDDGWRTSQRGCVSDRYNHTSYSRRFTKGDVRARYSAPGPTEDPQMYGAHCGPRDIGLLRLHYMEQWCVCDSDMCNDHDETIDLDDDDTQNTSEEPITETTMTPEKDDGKLKCYECGNGRSCSLPEGNYQITCKNVNSSFCYSTMEYNGTNWAVKERGCAGLMKKDKKLTIVPHRRYENWDQKSDQLEDQGYQFVSGETIEVYGDTVDCTRDASLLRPALKEDICACRSNLCNAEK